MAKVDEVEANLFQIPVNGFSWSAQSGAKALSLPEQIAQKIGTAIIQGHYEPGERIHEQELADNFGVSRGPVRDALRLLERDGFVQISARRGTNVTQLTPKEVIDVFNVRISLLGLAARLVAEQQDRQVLAELESRISALRQLSKTADVDRYLAAIYELNRLLPQASGNRYLSSTMLSLTYLALRYGRHALATPKGRRSSAERWIALFDAIKEGRAEDAEELACAMIRRSRDSAIEHLHQAPAAD